MKTNENTLKKFEIIRALSYVPPERLQDIESFIQFILYRSKIKTGIREKEPSTLAGIWKNKGFDKIPDLDKEIKTMRKELSNQILEKFKS